MLNPFLQSHPAFISIESLAIIWDFRLRILDLWNRYALSIYNRPFGTKAHDRPFDKKAHDRQNSLILKSKL
jgi:hypothetical protein